MNSSFSKSCVLTPLLILFISVFFIPTVSAFPDSTVTIDLTSSDSSVVQGDTLDFDVRVTNHTSDTLDVDLWFTILPDSGTESLIPAALLCVSSNPLAITLPPNVSKEKSCWLGVPSNQDTGLYTMFGKVGDYVNVDSLVTDQDSIRFEVVEAGSLGVYPWEY